jgi:hypothetical protein
LQATVGLQFFNGCGTQENQQRRHATTSAASRHQVFFNRKPFLAPFRSSSCMVDSLFLQDINRYWKSLTAKHQINVLRLFTASEKMHDHDVSSSNHI